MVTLHYTSPLRNRKPVFQSHVPTIGGHARGFHTSVSSLTYVIIRAFYGHLYSCPGAAITNSHKLDGLKQQKLIFSRFRRPEVWNQGVSRAGLPLEKVLVVTVFLVSSSLWCLSAGDCIILISASVFTRPSSVCVSLFQKFLASSLEEYTWLHLGSTQDYAG